MTRGASLLVGVFYFCVVVMGVLLLAAAQLRSSSGSRYDTWSVNYDSNDFLAFTYKTDLDAVRAKLSDTEQRLAFTDQCLKLYDESGKMVSGIDAQIVQDVKAAREAHKDANEFDGEVKCILRGYTLLQYDKGLATPQIAELKARIADLDKLVKANGDQTAELVKDHQDFLALKGMERQWHTWFFVVVPYDLLVLLLVMSMGALGGIVRLLRDYGDESHKDPMSKDYAFVPLIGLVVAVGGYILAKTGLLLLSSAKEEASLSPFMIGLVGIVSGLLAKEVIDRIAGAGRKILNAQEKAGATAQSGDQQTS
jgi:hypothetical protein